MIKDARILADFIDQEEVLAREVRVGDIIVSSTDLILVANIKIEPVPYLHRIYRYWATASRGIMILDEACNGGVHPEDKPVTIIARHARARMLPNKWTL